MFPFLSADTTSHRDALHAFALVAFLSQFGCRQAASSPFFIVKNVNFLSSNEMKGKEKSFRLKSWRFIYSHLRLPREVLLLLCVPSLAVLSSRHNAGMIIKEQNLSIPIFHRIILLSFVHEPLGRSMDEKEGKREKEKQFFSAGASKKMLSFYVIWGDITCFGSEMKYTIMGSSETHRSRLESFRQSLDSGFPFAPVSFE